MPTENESKKVEDLIDVGEEQGAEINLDDKGEPEKVETVKEEIEVEQVTEETPEKVEEKKAEPDELKEYSDGVQKRIAKLNS